jgi:hypothetical protein
LWQKSKDEVVLFTKNKRDWFYRAMCIEAWYTLNDLKWTKRGNAFVRKFNLRLERVNLVNSNKIEIPSKTIFRELLKWKNISVKFCV